MLDLDSGASKIIFDTSVLSNFAVVDRVSLLEDLYKHDANTTLMVADEIQHGVDAGYDYLCEIESILTSLQPDGWLKVLALDDVDEQKLYIDLFSTIDSGEASCLAIAIHRGFTLATDDFAARRIAKDRAVKLTGTVGILVRSVRLNKISLDGANRILKQMITLRFRSPVDNLDNLV